MIDIVTQINAVRREVSATGDNRTVVLRQTYDTAVEDLWDACTNAERIPRWLMPVSGELRLGGRYQLEGNAGGTIEQCEPPHSFSVTWEFAGAVSWVDVQVSAAGDDRATLQLTHRSPDGAHWQQFGPGAVGVGWDLSLYGLAIHLDSGANVPAEMGAPWLASEDGRRFMTSSGQSWCAADIAGGADPGAARDASQRTLAAYTG